MKPVANYGPYAILTRIASSRLATTTAARFRPVEDGDRIVTVRFLSDAVTSDAALRDRLVDEVKRAARLNHVNVSQTFDIARHGDAWYAALEFVDGLPLAVIVEQLTSSRRPMEPDVAAFIVAELCAALAYAHGRRDERGKPLDIVHADVRPRFVLVSRNGEVKLNGFGFSRALLEVRRDELLDRDDRLHFAAPEVLRGEAPTPRSDVYGAGMIAWTLLAGRRPFEGMAGAELRRNAEGGLVPALLEVEASVPEDLAATIARALAVDPEQRPRNATELRTALASWLRSTSPGFGRHRVKVWLQRSAADQTDDILPPGRWRALHRREFVPTDDASVLHEVADASGWTERDDLAAVLGAEDEFVLDDLPDWDVSAPWPTVAAAARIAATKSTTKPIEEQRSDGASTATKTAASTSTSDGDDDDQVFAARSFGDEPSPASVTATPPQSAGTQRAARSTTKADPAPMDLEPAGAVVATGASEVQPAAPRGDGIDAPSAPMVDLDYEAEVAAATASADSAQPTAEVEATADVDADEDAFDAEAIATAVYDDDFDEKELAAEVSLERKQARARRKAEDRAARRFPRAAVVAIVAVLAAGGAWYASTVSSGDENEAPVETMGSIFVTSRPAGAEILVDDQRIGRTTPAPIDGLAAGRDVRISVELAGHVAPEPRTYAVEGGSQGEVRFELTPVAHRVRVTSDPEGAGVIHGGHVVGQTPTMIEAYPVGGRYEATVILRMDGYFDEPVNIVWDPDETDSSVRVALRIDENWEPPDDADER